jgi:CheY-like chemotaxis protein
MDQAIVVAVISILPQLAIVVLVAIAAITFRRPLARLIDERVSGVSAFGFSISLRPAEVDEAVAQRVGADTRSLTGTSVGTQVVERATRNAARLAGKTILWVDDHPENNRIERRMLRQVGMFVEAVTTNRHAISALGDADDHFDLVISDIGRDEESTDGLALLGDIRDLASAPPVILYVGSLKPGHGTPPGAFGITNRPDTLLNLVMDVLDR